ncbi:uncharacterized protein JCM15063_003364 [Sporobolomyces koalae]|uniref:uncharacterized protein n=1 Tax=Sporobolomyces koalae TaxID=500713 RepID=UPI00316CF92F
MNFKTLLQEGQDEAVSVNQRALVEKILARYSGEHTVFRELLQNSDDAGAAHVELHFKTTASSTAPPPAASSQLPLPDLKTTKCASIVVQNDGMVFRKEDWARLTEIASGNPDETKIGAFGVGFYSLFSLCDEPVVSSGNTVVGFHWKGGGDQLFVRKATDESGLSNVSPEGKPWSTFLMDLREPQPMPEPNDFSRFLCSCLGFTTNLRILSLYFDSHLLFRAEKTLAPSRNIAVRSNLSSTSPLKILRLTSIEEAPIQIKADVSRWMLQYASKPKSAPSLAAAAATTTSFASKMLAAFSSRSASPSLPPSTASTPSTKPEFDPLSRVTVTLFLRTVAATLQVSPSKQFSLEMIRATKKPLPSVTKYALIWTGKDEFEASRGEQTADGHTEARRVFSGLLSDLDVQGRVSIGFPTFQTSGCASSVGARFISTVERESLDFQSRYVSDWNRELLWAGGVLARSVFEEEMSEIGRLWQTEKPQPSTETRKRLEDRALHLIKFFTFSPSTPQEIVGALSESAFFLASSDRSLTLISSIGITSASKLRLPNTQLAGFVKGIAVVPESIATGAPRFIAVLRDKGLIRDIDLEDIFADLSSHPLTISEAVDCLKWWTALSTDRSYEFRLLTRLKDAAMLSVPSGSDTTDISILPFGAYKTFLNAKIIPVDVPLPSTTLPFELSRQFTYTDLVRIFQFSELSLADWLRHLLSPSFVGQGTPIETDMTRSPPFAERILNVLAKAWAQTSVVAQREIIVLLADKPIIPTRIGSRQASDAYFPNVSLFDDLAIVALPSGASVKGNMERLLLSLGVRKHVELQLVFTRLLGAGDWSHVQLVRYLVSVRDTLTATETDRLRKTSWLPREGEDRVAGAPGPNGEKGKPKTIRYPASQLYEPTDVLRAIGLPLVDWTASQTKWRSNSDEAKLLFDLGLLRTPPVDKVLEIAATGPSTEIRQKALRYFLDGCVTLGYGSSYSPTKHNLPFVPALLSGKETLVKPTEVFGNPQAALLGFAILSPNFASEESRFRIARDPSGSRLASALVASPPQDIASASKVFAYLSSQVSQFDKSDIETLQFGAWVPLRHPGGTVEIVSPLNLFFSSDSTLPAGLRKLFVTIPDFGASARPFLLACGVKDSPSTLEIASMLIGDPKKFFDLCGSAERYLSILRLLAHHYSSLPTTMRSRMKMAALFLGTKRIVSANSSVARTLLDDDTDEEDEGETTLVYQLARASDLVINDEPAAFRVFQAEILACPQEDALEALAESLGAHRISSLVTEHYRTTGEPDAGGKRVAEIKRTVAERASLFLAERRQQYGKSELKRPDPEWIQTHLQVSQVRTIELIRTLKTVQGLKKHATAASACAQLGKTGDIELYISETLDVDYYEVALGICKMTLTKLRPNDALLLLTILQTTLKNLKRRGFNVDRILNARKAEREAADQRLREERLQDQLRSTDGPAKLEQDVERLSEMFPDASVDFLRTLLQTQAPPNALENAAKQLLASPHYPKRQNTAISSSQQSRGTHEEPNQLQGSPATQGGGLFSNWRKQFKPKPSASAPAPAPAPALPPPPSLAPGPSTMSGSSGGGSGANSRPGMTPTPTAAVRANLTRAIQAARPETAANVDNAVEKTEVKEADSYCDTSAAASLSFVASVASMRFYCSREVDDPTGFVSTHHDALTRLVTKILQPIGEVFGINPQALNVFHDREGPLIAFNRNGTLYINFRYYLAWHDEQVQRGDSTEALISNFHTVAHELAHNLVKPHDAQHSFYFSSFCEEYFLRMSQLIARGSLRLASAYTISGNTSFAYRHWGCVTEKQILNMKDSFEAADEIDGFEDIPGDDQERVRKAFQDGHVADEDIPDTARKPEPASDEEEKPKKRKTTKRKKKEDSDEEEEVKAEEEEEKPKKKKAPAKKKTAKKVKKDESEEEEEEEEAVSTADEEEEKPKKKKAAAPKQKAAPKKKAAPPRKKAKKEESEDEHQESDEE